MGGLQGVYSDSQGFSRVWGVAQWIYRTSIRYHPGVLSGHGRVSQRLERVGFRERSWGGRLAGFCCNHRGTRRGYYCHYSDPYVEPFSFSSQDLDGRWV